MAAVRGEVQMTIVVCEQRKVWYISLPLLSQDWPNKSTMSPSVFFQMSDDYLGPNLKCPCVNHVLRERCCLIWCESANQTQRGAMKKPPFSFLRFFVYPLAFNSTRFKNRSHLLFRKVKRTMRIKETKASKNSKYEPKNVNYQSQIAAKIALKLWKIVQLDEQTFVTEKWYQKSKK